MKKIFGIFSVMLLILCLVPITTSAQTNEDLNTGWRTPDEFGYSLEVSIDELGMNLGFRNAEDVAVKRASEAKVMSEENKPEEFDKAMKNLDGTMERVRDRARNGKNSEGIDKAMNNVSDILDNLDVPKEAERGIETAKKNVDDVKDISVPEQSDSGIL